MCIGSSDNEDQ